MWEAVHVVQNVCRGEETACALWELNLSCVASTFTFWAISPTFLTSSFLVYPQRWNQGILHARRVVHHRATPSVLSLFCSETRSHWLVLLVSILWSHFSTSHVAGVTRPRSPCLAPIVPNTSANSVIIQAIIYLVSWTILALVSLIAFLSFWGKWKEDVYI